LDPERLTIAESNGLKVFPRQWTDFKMQCSCPDWAVPCKHLAAVIYQLSAEIDNNPFLVFRLHRVDLPMELKKENIHIEDKGDDAIPVLATLLLPGKDGRRKQKRAVVAAGNTTPYAKPDLSSLAPLTDALIQLLSDAPVFYQHTENFREKYTAVLRKVVRSAQKILHEKAQPDELLDVSSSSKTTKPFGIDPHTRCRLSLTAENKASVWINDKKMSVSIGQLALSLWHLPAGRMQDYQPSIAALRNVLLVGMNLVANGATIPQMYKTATGKYGIRWLPALISEEVSAAVAKLQSFLPGGLLWLEEQEIDGEHMAADLLSVFLDLLVHGLSGIQAGDIFLDLFFRSSTHPFNGTGQKSLAGGIQSWLQRYYLTQGAFKPILLVEELRGEKFRLTVNIHDNSTPFEPPVPLVQMLSQKKFERVRFEVLQTLSQLSPLIPGLDHHINANGREGIQLDTAGLTPFLLQAIPAIRLLGISVLLPKSLQQILKPRASIRVKQKANGETALRLDKLLDFDWQVAIGDHLLDEEAFRKLVKSADGLVKYKSSYIYVSAGDLEKLHKHFTQTDALSPFKLLRVALGDDYFGARVELTDEVKQLIKELTSPEDIPLPNGLNARLRPYQHRGYSWMVQNTRIGFGSVIADDMGLGKTVQVIATLLRYKEDGLLKDAKALVIAPTGLLTNWQAELEKFAPSLRYKIYHGTGRNHSRKESYDIILPPNFSRRPRMASMADA